MKTTFIAGTLQIDHERGVIYFHSDQMALEQDNRCPTPLRICGLGNVEFPYGDRQIDITLRPLGIQGRSIIEAMVVK